MPDDVLPFIPEESRRWPDFRGGMPVELPDGQPWIFFQPEAVLRNGAQGWTFGADVPADVDAVLSARFARIIRSWERTDEAGRATAILTAAWFLLARNYSIKAEEFQAIMARANTWSEAAQTELGQQLLACVGLACARASSLTEVA